MYCSKRFGACDEVGGGHKLLVNNSALTGDQESKCSRQSPKG